MCYCHLVSEPPEKEQLKKIASSILLMKELRRKMQVILPRSVNYQWIQERCGSQNPNVTTFPLD